MSDDDPSLLGGLPRTRPGRRSGKRPSERAEAAGDRSRRTAAAAPQPDQDPVGDALRTAARAAETGLRVAGELTREVLRRLPRP